MCLMLDILGWKFDNEGPKSDDFSKKVSALGVQFVLDDTCNGALSVCNTERRVEDTTAMFVSVIKEDKMSKKEALRLRGKLAFCDAFIFGRLGKLALQNITKHAYASPFVAKLTQRLVESLLLLRDRLLSGRPRVLTCKMLDAFFIFTDASFRKDEGGGF